MSGLRNKRNFKIIKLKFKSSLHLGLREGFLEGTDVIIHSDTLFSAFCYCYYLLYGKDALENILKKFSDGTPPFIISSAFPCWNEKIYFPIPHNKISNNKKVKKVKFIEKEGLEQLINGSDIDEVVHNYKTIPSLEEILATPYAIRESPRVSLSRLSNHPGENFFFFSELWYRNGAGLYFLIHFYDREFQGRFHSVLRLMADEGIGGDRTVGKGLFENNLTINEVNINVADNASASLILSLYHPARNEISDLKEGYYMIMERKGYIFSPFAQNIRKKTVRMFSEGSVFPGLKKGDVVDVSPDGYEKIYGHKVYRYGLAFSLPCKLSNEN